LIKIFIIFYIFIILIKIYILYYNIKVEDSSLSSNNSTPNQSSSNSKIKRPMNAFLIYSVKRRRELSHENPALTTSEISTILGDEWAKMDPVSIFIKFKILFI